MFEYGTYFIVIARFSLNGNQIGDEGAEVFATVLEQNSTITELQ